MTSGIRPAPRDDVALMTGYHSPQIEVAVRLNTNEAPDPPPVGFHERLAVQVHAIDWNRYPDRGASALRARIAEVEGVPAAGVFAANGSNEVLQTLLLAYGGAGRSVLVAEPTYALHSHIARLTGTRVMSEPRNEGFAMDVDRYCDAIVAHAPSVVFLCSPNNPTGMVEERSTVVAVTAAARQVGAVVVVDEAYGQFAPWSAIELVNDDSPLVVTRTFSKTWSMAAARLGYLVGPSWIVDQLDAVALPYHLDAAKQVAGVIALDYVEEMAARVARLVEQRGRVVAGLSLLPVRQWPSGANFILFRPDADAEAVWQGLVERSVLVRNCASWPNLDGCLRVTIGTPEENDVFLDTLADVLAALGESSTGRS